MQIKNLIKFKKNSKLTRLNKLYSDLLKTKHLLTFFIGGLKRHQFLKLWKLALNKHLFSNFLIKLECRLEFVLLKAGFALSGKQAKQLILHGHVFINGFNIQTYNYLLKLYDIISIKKIFIPQYMESLVCNLFKTTSYFYFLKKKNILKKISINQYFVYFKFSSFFEVNYRTFTICLVRKPILQEFFIPRIMSLYDCNQLYILL